MDETSLQARIPGVVIDELQTGEEPVPHSTTGTEVNFVLFEEAVMQGIARACEVPPEILKLAFSSSYSVSREVINKLTVETKRDESIWDIWVRQLEQDAVDFKFF